MGLDSELELVKVLENHGMKTVHRLKKTDINGTTNPAAMKWLKKNKELPRKTHAFEVDVFAYKEGHWGALSIEEKSQKTQKFMDFEDDDFALSNKHASFHKESYDLFLQTCGSAYLSSAYNAAKGLDRVVVPLAVVEYTIRVMGMPSKWAFFNGVFFVQKKHFDWFVEEFLNKDWVRHHLTGTT